MYHLSIEERDELASALTPEQQAYLTGEMVRGRRTVFARHIAKRKGYMIPDNATFEEVEQLTDGWIYTGYRDAGHVSPHYPCECGRPLRYQHTVKHSATGEERKFGIDHLELHTGIDAKTVQQIVKGFDAIDLELSEVLIKLSGGWSLARSVEPIPDGFEMPADIARHLELGLPLLDRQLVRLKALIRAHGAAKFQRKPLKPAPPAGLPKPAPVPDNKKPALPAEPVQMSLLLFPDEEEEEETAVPAVVPPPPQPVGLPDSQRGRFGLPPHHEQAVRTYVSQGVSSARVICELLIKHNGASDDRYLSSKPKIYAAVCLFLETLPHVEAVSVSPEDSSWQPIIR